MPHVGAVRLLGEWVDFHWEVNGKTYDFSIPGGGFVSFTDLIEVLGITGVAEPDEHEAESDATEPAADALLDVAASDEAKEFVADVESVAFSTPDLVDVSKVDNRTTVGEIKESRGLACEYSEELTEEQIAKINSTVVESGDWALISMRPFLSDETLTVTMKNGEAFTIRVTDAQIKKTVIDAKGDTWEITVNYGEDAQIPDDAELKVREILPEDEEYQDYYQQSLEAAGAIIPEENLAADTLIDASDSMSTTASEVEDYPEIDAQTAQEANREYARIFDIEIQADGEKVEPKTEVYTTIKLLDISDSEDTNLKVVHFAASGIELIETETRDGEIVDETTLNFVTSEFSVYSVVNVNGSTNLNGQAFALVSGIANDKGEDGWWEQDWQTTDYYTKVVNAHAMTDEELTIVMYDDVLGVKGIGSTGVHAWTDGANSYVGGDVPEYHFESVGNNQYIIYVVKNGTNYYIDQYNDNQATVSLSANRAWATRFSITPNSDGTVLIHNGNWYLHNTSDSRVNGFDEWRTRNYTMSQLGSVPTGNEYKFKLCKVSEDYDSFAAKKIPVQEADSSKTVIIYRKILDEDGTERLYAVAQSGNLVRVYDGGDSIYWRETDEKLHWVVDTVTDPETQRTSTYIHSPQSDGMPVVYLSPFKTDNQKVTSESATNRSVYLSGKSEGNYGSAIEVWDQEAYDYAGLHVNEVVTKDSNGKVTAVNSVSLEAGTRGTETTDVFLFAEVSSMPPAEKTQVATVDSEKLGIHITVFDYGKYGDGNEYPAGKKLDDMTNIAGSAQYTPHEAHALVQPYLSALTNGVPVSTTKGAMNGLFKDDSVATIDGVSTYVQSGVTDLFLASYYNESGMFRYRSEDNYAYLGRNGETHFKVYQQVGSPYPTENVIGHPYYYHGHYMPFNDLDTSKVTSRLVDQEGTNELDLGDGRTYDAIYGVSGVPNYYTGMKMEAEFSQPRNGKLENGDDMIFKFTGDDDMWVYIDGVLVLDVGGIHEPLSGTINFRTGKVTNPTGSSLAGTKTLYEILTAAASNPNTPEETRAKIASIQWKDVDGNGTPDTFADYGNHSFAAFYMERGAGASNLDLQFNLKTVLTNQFTVGKELPEEVDTRFINKKYRFQATFYDDTDLDENGQPKEKPLFAGATKKDGTTVVCDKVYYQGHKNTSGEPVEDPVAVDTEGYFYLNAGEVAVFHMKDDGIRYNVKEVDIDQYHLEKITINGTETDHVNINDDPTFVEENVAEAGASLVRERSSVLYTNYPKTQALKITKHIIGTAPEDTNPTFEFHVYLETTEKDEHGNDVHKIIPYSNGPYYLTKEVEGQTHYFQLTGKNDEKGWTNLPVDKGTTKVKCSDTGSSGSISRIPPEYTIVIPDLAVGTHFYLVERLDNLPEGCSYVRENLTEGTYDPKTMDPVLIEKSLAQDEVEVADTYDPDTIGKIKSGVDAESHIYNRYGIAATKEWQDVDGNTTSGESPLWPANVTFKIRKKIVTTNGDNEETISYADVSRPAYYTQPAHSSEEWSDTITVNSPTAEANWSHLDTLPDGQSYVIIEHAIAGVAESDIVRDEKSGAIKSFKLKGKIYNTTDSELGEDGGKVINKEQKLTDIEVEKKWNPAEGLEPGSSTMVLYQVIGQKETEEGEVDPAQPSEQNMRVHINVNKVDESGDPAVVSDSAYVTVSYAGTDKDGEAISGTYTLNNTNGWSYTFEIPRYSTVNFTYTEDGVKVIELAPVKSDGVDSSRTIDIEATVLPSSPHTYTFTVPKALRAGLPENGKIKVSVPSSSDTSPQYADSMNNWTVTFTVPDEANVEYTVEPENGFISSVTTSGRDSGQPALQNETIEMIPTAAETQIKNIPVSINWTGEDVPAGTGIVVTFTPNKPGVPSQSVTLNGTEYTPWNTTETLQRLDDNGDLITWNVTAAKETGTEGKVSVTSTPSTGATISDIAGSGVVVDGSVAKETMTVPITIDWGNETPDAGTTVTVTFTTDKAGVAAEPVNLTANDAGTGTEAHKWISTATLPRIDSNGDLVSWTAAAAVTAPSGTAASVSTTTITDIKDDNGDGEADKSAEWTGSVARGMNLTINTEGSANTSALYKTILTNGLPYYSTNDDQKIGTVEGYGRTTSFPSLETKDSSNNDLYYVIVVWDNQYEITTNADVANYIENGQSIENGNTNRTIIYIKAQSGDVSINLKKSDHWSVSTGQPMNSISPTISAMSVSNRRLIARRLATPRSVAASPVQTFADTNAPVNGNGTPFTAIQFRDLPKGATIVAKDGKENNGKQTVTGNRSFKWEDLPTVDADGNPIYYYVVEKDATAQADTISVKYEYEYNADGTIKKVKITNSTTGTPTPTTGSVKVTKAFSGIDSLPAGFKITATYNDGDDQSVDLTLSTLGRTGTGTTADPYTWELFDLPLDTVVTFTESGYEKTGYTVTTSPVADNNVVSDTATVVTDPMVENGGIAKFINTYERITTDVEATKTWDDLEAGKTHPTIYFKLYYKTEDGDVAVSGAELKKLENGTTSVTWNGVPQYDEDGNEYEYHVKEYIEDEDGEYEEGGLKYTEAAPEGYIKHEAGLHVDNDESDQYNPTTTYSGTKTWVDMANDGKTRPDSLRITLKADGKAVDGATPTWVMKNETGVWEYTFTDLPVFGSDGHVIAYTVEETQAPGYTAGSSVTPVSYQVLATGQESPTTKTLQRALLSDRTLNTTITIANETDIAYVVFSRLRLIDGTIVWTQRQLTADEEAYFKEQFNLSGTVHFKTGLPYQTDLHAAGSTINDGNASISMRGKTVTLRVVNYAIMPLDVTYGTLKYTYNEGTTELTNTLETDTYDVQKFWGEEQAAPEGAKVVITLKGTISGTATEENPNPDPVQINLSTIGVAKTAATLNGGAEGGDDTTENPWVYSWTNLPKYDKDGNRITYTAEETSYKIGDNVIDLTTYSPATDSDSTYELIATNQLPTTTFRVTKEWVNSNNNTPPTGATITATLYKGPSAETATTEVSGIVLNGTADYNDTAHVEGEPNNEDAYEDSAWHAFWKNLPVYDTDGTKISYVVKESVTYNGYTVSYEKLKGADKDYALDKEIITNSKSSYSFDVLKVEEDTTKALSGASFTIQKVEAESTTSSVAYVGDTSPSNPETTGSDGKVSFNNIALGYYEVKETQTPAGYVITGDAAFYIKIESTGIKLLEKEIKNGKLSFKEAASTKVGNVTIATQGAEVTFTVENTPGAALPNTGGPGTWLFTAFGSFLILLSGALLWRRRRLI